MDNKDVWSADTTYANSYLAHQDDYRREMRESDKQLIDLVASRIANPAGVGVSLLDVGCSSGTLLFNLGKRFPHMSLAGIDSMAEAVEKCQADLCLKAAKVSVGNVLELSEVKTYDVIVSSAALLYLNEEEFAEAMRRCTKALKPGGILITWDFYHPFRQELEIKQSNHANPEGVTWFYRSYGLVEKLLTGNGMSAVEFEPFYMPFDRPQKNPLSEDDNGLLLSFTHQIETGDRLSFAGGALFSWCYLIGTRGRDED